MENKHIAISGATRGMGYALAKELMKMGHRVSGCGRSEDIIEKMNRKFSKKGQFTPVDICSQSQVNLWKKACLRKPVGDLGLG